MTTEYTHEDLLQVLRTRVELNDRLAERVKPGTVQDHYKSAAAFYRRVIDELVTLKKGQA